MMIQQIRVIKSNQSKSGIHLTGWKLRDEFKKKTSQYKIEKTIAVQTQLQTEWRQG